MSGVQTVLGAVDSAELGVVLPHEHLFINMYRITRNTSHVLDDMDSAVDDLCAFRAAGGASIVELTNNGIARDPIRLAEASRRSGVHVIMGCGWYREPFYDPRLQSISTESIAVELCEEINHGIDGIRPGVIGEIGADREFVSGIEERVLRAAGRASTRTGAAVITHAVKSAVGLAQLDILEEEGVDLRRVAVSHCDSYLHTDYHLAIASRGAYVSFDRHNGRNPLLQRRRIEAVTALIRAGHADRVLLSQDVCHIEDRSEAGGPGFTYVLGHVVPALVAEGVRRELVEGILRDNPQRLLSGLCE